MTVLFYYANISLLMSVVVDECCGFDTDHAQAPTSKLPNCRV